MSKIKFGDVLYIKGRIGRQALKKDEYLDHGDYYLVTGVDITNEHRIDFKSCYYVSKERYDMDEAIQLKEGDIIVTKDGTIGKIGIIENLDKPATLNSHLFLIRNKAPEILSTEFLFYVLNSKHFQKFATNNTTGSNIPAFTQKNISEYSIDLPDIKLQNKIASLLSSIDAKIRNNNKINSELEAMAKEIYDYWFIQFDFPNENGKPYKSSGGKMVWNDELKREIPDGWSVEMIKDTFGSVGGYSFSSDDYVENGKYKLYTIGNVQDGYIVSEVDNYLDYLPDNMPEECLLKPGEMLMSLTGNVGRVGFVYENNALLNQRVLKLQSEKGHKAFMYMTFIQDSMRLTLERISNGTSQKNLSPINMGKLKMIVPPEEVLKKYDSMCNPMIDKMVNNFAENQKLSELRDFLLPMLMNGQMTVK